jgi:hypothetical protein
VGLAAALGTKELVPTAGDRGRSRSRLCIAQTARALPELEKSDHLIISRLRLDAALYEPAPPRRPHQMGRARLNGERLPNLCVVDEDPTTVWKPTKSATIQPGKRDDARAIFEEIRTSRREEYETSRKRLGIREERVWLQSLPDGEMAVVYWEGDDPRGALERFASSDDPFDEWLKERGREVYHFEPVRTLEADEEVFASSVGAVSGLTDTVGGVTDTVGGSVGGATDSVRGATDSLLGGGDPRA